jgi:hypothetical protein
MTKQLNAGSIYESTDIDQRRYIDMIWRFLLYTIIGVYILHKLGVIRFNFSAQVGNKNPNRNFNRQPPDGRVNVDSAPPKEKQKKDFKGGEYVDYEDVK